MLTYMTLSAILLATPAFALPPQTHQVGFTAVAAVKTTNDLRLIETIDGAKWMTEAEVGMLVGAKQHNFMDITEHQSLGEGVVAQAIPLPKTLRLQGLITPLLTELSKATMKANLESFTTFHTRYYKSTTGTDSANWLFDEITAIIDAGSSLRRHQYQSVSPASVTKFKHPNWDQFSIVARFEGSTESQDTVILGAHQDSVAGFFNKAKSRSPGADDDGSGSMTVLDVFRVLVNNGFAPRRPVEFHWYSGEEAGLLGSQAIAQSYKSAGRSVMSMLQIDMDGYTGKQNVVGLMTDFVAPAVVDFLKTVITTYANIPIAETKCKYACSDHASWTKAGFPAGFTTEAEMSKSSPFIHTKDDTVDKIDFDHMLEFAKMALAYVMELGLYDA